MKIKELREKDLPELNSLKLELLREQFNLRVQRAMGQGIKNHQFSQSRKEIARINTIIGEKEAKTQ